MSEQEEFDQKLIGKYTMAAWGYKQGEMISLMIHLGHRLGLYKALDGAGEVTSIDLANITGLHERWLREWLRSQAAAQLLKSTDGEVFLLEPEAALLLAREGSSKFAAGAFAVVRPKEVIDGIINSFKTGLGLDYDGLGAESAQHVEGMLGPMTKALLLPKIIPSLPGVAEKLESGARVVDIGCGGGMVIDMLAEAFPASTYVGYDPSERAIELATKRLEGKENVELLLAGGEDLPDSENVDLVITFDCLHDMPRPDLTMKAIRGAIATDGTWLIKDIKSSAKWEDNLKNPMLAFMYATSVGSCLQSAMSEPEAFGLGTLGLNPEVAEEMVREAGFTRFDMHDFHDPTNLYYEVRP
jgi:SAM-dependent methyltransferase